MTVRGRLVLAILCATALMAVPSLIAHSRLQETRDLAVELQERHAAAGSAVGELRSALGEANLAIRGYVATGDTASRRRLSRAVTSMAAAAARLQDTGYGPEARRIQELVRAIRASVYQVTSLVEAGELERATRGFQGVEPLVVRADSALATVDRRVRERSGDAARRARSIVTGAQETTTLVLVGAILLAFVVGGGMAETVVRPIHRLRGAMETTGSVAAPLSPPDDLDYDRSDELGALNRAFRRMTRELAEADRLKAEFLSAASHKLKTPVSVVLGYLEMLRHGEFGEVGAERREVLEEMDDQLGELTTQIDQLMRLSRAEAGELRLEYQEVFLAEMAEALRDAFRASARQKAIRFDVEVRADAPERIRADGERLRDLVLGNLLDNAFRYCGRGDRVELGILGANPESDQGPALATASDSEPGDGTEAVWFRVRDTGPGIPRDERERIFEPYHRVTEGEGDLGTGMGLAIARQVVRAHGGRVHAGAPGGEGSVFVVRIPVEGPRAR